MVFPATRARAAIMSLAIALVALASVSAYSKEVTVNDVTVEADRLVRQFVADSGAPGVSVSVGLSGRLIWSKGVGYADLEQHVLVDPAATKFRIGSVAKPLTALALVTLVSQGRIDLDADVRRYVPVFPKKKYPFTVRQLAGHLAGIRHYVGDEAYLRKQYSSVLESLDVFKDAPLIGVPGAAWKYSSYGYNLLSAVIEQAAGKPFLDYMAESIFVPLGMTATVPDHIKELVPNRGRYYVRKDGKIYNEPEVDNSYKWASGGFLSTTDDLVRFGLAHMSSQRVTPAMRSLLWTEQKTTAGKGTGYGMGWRILVDKDWNIVPGEKGNKWIGHGGGSIGGTTQFWLLPDRGLVIAIASNLTELDFGDLLPRLGKIFIEHPSGQSTSRSATIK